MVWIIISGILILLGIVGTAAPFLPGPPLALGGLLLYGYTTDFAGFSTTIVIIFAVLTVLSFAIDFAAPALGARGHKSSRYGVIGATMGGLLGVVFMGPIGILAGPILGAFLGEIYTSRDLQKAIRATWGALFGFLIGMAIKLGIVFAMAIYFIYLLIT